MSYAQLGVIKIDGVLGGQKHVIHSFFSEVDIHFKVNVRGRIVGVIRSTDKNKAYQKAAHSITALSLLCSLPPLKTF